MARFAVLGSDNMNLYVLVLLFVLPTSADKNSETILLEHLQNESSPYARPVLNSKDPVNVTFGFELIHIVSVIESTQSVEMKLWLRMSWKNELLTWDPTKYGNISSTRLSSTDVWTPDIFLLEDIGQEMSSGPERYKTQVILMSNGIHYWNIPSLVQSSCIFDVTNFPFDRQNCTLKYISWSYDQTELDIIEHDKPIVTESNYVTSASWDLHAAAATVISQKYNCCPNPYVFIKYVIVLHREPHFYFYNVVIPCIIQMLIILFTFFLPPDSGERVSVAITVLLVFAVYLEVLSSSLPKTSSSAPALSRFYLAAMSGSAISIMATCFVLVIHFKGAEKGIGPMPKWVKDFFLNKVAIYLFVRKNLRQHEDADLLALDKQGSYESLKGKDERNGIDNKLMVQSLSIASEANMEKLVEEVRVITELIHDQNLQDEIEEEWQILAKVFDRLFFIVFFLFFVISSLVILLPVMLVHSEYS